MGGNLLETFSMQFTGQNLSQEVPNSVVSEGGCTPGALELFGLQGGSWGQVHFREAPEITALLSSLEILVATLQGALYVAVLQKGARQVAGLQWALQITASYRDLRVSSKSCNPGELCKWFQYRKLKMLLVF